VLHVAGVGSPEPSQLKSGASPEQVMNASKADAQAVARLASQPHRQLVTLSGPREQ
jgi:hypothetical protein